MNKRNPLANVPLTIQQFVTLAPAYPWTGPGLIRRLKEAVDMAECGPGLKLPQSEFGSLIGAATTTLHDWTEGDLPYQMQALLCGLERLPENEWIRFLRGFFRECPRLEHPALSHDQKATNSLKELLSRTGRLIIIRGTSPHERSFLLHALANSSRRFGPMRRICGLDVTDPAKYSPVPGVFHLRSGLDPGQVRRVVLEMWPLVLSEACEVLVLNGALSAAPEIMQEVKKLSKERLVILADEFPGGLPTAKTAVIDVTRDKRTPGLLRVSVSRVG